ncbi:kinase-like protein [Thelephora ganbajun]|uniref:Kinase-like protein n=1 Tax=Thelephora ganbajun TaxID=370292 RepID=A0ACB6ZB95_THEGA|nr:kinase-like protein [Thelephora ganbajun]
MPQAKDLLTRLFITLRLLFHSKGPVEGTYVPLLAADGPNQLESPELDLLPVDPEALREHHLDLVLHLQESLSTNCEWLEQEALEIVGGHPVDAGGFANVWVGIMGDRKVAIKSYRSHGIEYIHKLNVVHGDIKITNILVGADGRARIAGLGAVYISSLVPGMDIDRFSKVHGSAPELVHPQLLGLTLAKATKESDVYAFGALAYEVFAGRAPPFGEGGVAGILPKLGGRPPPGRPNHPELSDRLWGMIKGCLESTPSQRKTSTEIVVALDAESSPRSS